MPTSALHTEAAAGGEDPRAGEAEEEGAWWPAATPGGRATPGATPGAPLEGEDTEPGGAGEAASGGRAAMAVGSSGGDVNDFVFMVFIQCFFCSFFSCCLRGCVVLSNRKVGHLFREQCFPTSQLAF